jgi:hypothetical protein
VKFLPSGVVHSAANGIAGFISRIPIGITVLPTRVRAESSIRDDISKLYGIGGSPRHSHFKSRPARVFSEIRKYASPLLVVTLVYADVPSYNG